MTTTQVVRGREWRARTDYTGTGNPGIGLS